MHEKAPQLLKLSAGFIVIALIAIFIQPFLLLLHGFVQNSFGGYSTGKMALVFAWLIAMPPFSFLLLRLKITDRLEKHSGLFLKLFVIIAVAGFALGLLQLFSFSSEFQGLSPYATINADSTNWEASKITHNHFPKLTIYYLQKSLGFDLGSKLDNGMPWYSVFPNPDFWAAGFIIILALLIVFGFLHLNSRKQCAFDHLLFSLSILGAIINIIDGGIGSSYASVTVFIFFLYIARNYWKTKSERVNKLLPLFAVGFLVALVYPAIGPVGTDIYIGPWILALGLGYYIIKSRRERLFEFDFINSVIAILLILSLAFSLYNIVNLGFGRELPAGSIGGIYLYGIPKETTVEQLQAELSAFGEVVSISKAGWAGYVQIKPEKSFRTSEVEILLRQKFNPETYLYAEENLPMEHAYSFMIYWLEPVDPNDYLDKEFLDIELLKLEHNAETNTSMIVVRGKTDLTWQMLSILSEIRAKGYKGKTVLVRM